MSFRISQALADEIAHREGLLPLQRITSVALGAALVARLDEISRGRALVEAVAFVGFGRHVFHQLDLEDEGADAVQQCLAVVDLDRHRRLRPVRDDDVGAGLDAAAPVFERVVGDILDLTAARGGEQRIAALLVAVEARDHPVRHLAPRA